MISAGEFRKGVTFEFDHNIYVILEFQHVKPGKGAAFVRTKMKNIMTGQVIDRTFNPTEKMEEAKIDKKEMQYLYNEGGIYYFMDMETYDQIPFNYDQVQDTMKYVVENMMISVQFYKGKAFMVEPPMFVELTITDCDPGVQGDTSKSSGKPATLETGLTIQVPLFVNQGEKIRVDTRSGSYMERL